MRPHVFDPHWMLPWATVAGGGLRTVLRWASRHTGLPVILVAAIGLVASWRVFKRTMHFGVEVALALVLLLVATRLGWLRW
jgi:hypothetical protein